MKVLHLISSGGLYGAETMLLNLATAQQRLGWEPTLGAFKNVHAIHLEVADEGRKRGLPIEIFECKGQFDTKIVKSIRNFVEANGVDIVHGHGYKSDLYGYLAIRPLAVPFVGTCHFPLMAPARTLSIRFYEFVDSLVLRRAQRVAGVSDLVAVSLRKAGVAAEKVSAIDNGTDLTRYKGATPTLRQDLGIGNRPLIGAVARLEEVKGLEYLIQAAQGVLAEFPDAMFVIAGDGPRRAHLESLIHSLGLDANVRLAGRRDDMPGVYASLDLFVLPSLDEGMPMVILEAMASGRPVIATRVGGVGKLVQNEETGLLLEARDVPGLRDAILRCLRDREFAGKLAGNGEELVRTRFSSDGMAKNYLNLYGQVLNGHK